MTCVAALEASGGVWLASDVCVSIGDQVDTCGPKWFSLGSATAACAGDDGLITRVRAMRVADCWPDPVAWACRKLVPQLREELGEYDSDDFDMLVVHAGQVVRVSGNLGVWRSGMGYNAIGTGEGMARASLWSTERTGGLDGESRVKLAVMAACALCGGVRGPVETIWCGTSGY